MEARVISALIFAGGVGSRMHSSGIPKQFLQVYGKPIIIYTLEHFQQHPLVDRIVVVSVSSHIKLMKDIIKKYEIDKVFDVVPGGKTGQESIWNGLKIIQQYSSKDDIVLIHDGVRPVIDEKLISDNIESVKKYGNAISACFAWETICQTQEQDIIKSIFPREECLLAKAPQSFFVQDIIEAHLKAQAEGINSMTDSASIMNYYGHKLHYVACSPSNIKITNPVDFYLFRGMLSAQESMQIMGL